MTSAERRKPRRGSARSKYEKIDVEYVYEDERGNPIPVPLGSYRPEDYEEEVFAVEDEVPADGEERPAAPVPPPPPPEPDVAIEFGPPPDEPAVPAGPVGPAGVPSSPARPTVPGQARPLLLRGVWRGFQSGGGRVEVLKDVGLELAPGELAIVAGPSGSGKSTLLSVMGGLLRADRGEVSVFGRNLTKLPETELQAVRRREMGFIFQNIYLMPALSAIENVRVALDIKGREGARAAEDDLLAMVGMADYARRLPGQLSGGQCQRVAVARALAGRPRVILADEPTAALDTDNALGVMKLIKDLTVAEGLATVTVTHDVRLFGFADRVLSLDSGRLREVRRHD